MPLPQNVARMFVERVRHGSAQKKNAFEFVVGVIHGLSLVLPSTHPDLMHLGWWAQVVLSSRGYEELQQLAALPDQLPLEVSHPLWRVSIKGAGDDGTCWDLQAPDLDTALKFGKALAFDAGWRKEQTSITVERLRADGTAANPD